MKFISGYLLVPLLSLLSGSEAVGSAVSYNIQVDHGAGGSHNSARSVVPSPLDYLQNPQVTYVHEAPHNQLFGYPSGPSSPWNYIAPQEQTEARCGAEPVGCPPSKYRSFDGSCNNLKLPGKGSANSRYGRLVPPIYSDGIHAPAVSAYGNELPNPRVVSLQMFPDGDITDPLWTLANMQWGQIVTHDMSLLAGSTQSKPHTTRCCTNDGKLIEKARAHTTCLAIVIPHDDPVYRHTNRECMNFVRTITDRDRGCQTHHAYPAEQLTVVTAYMDLSLVYGNSQRQNIQLRAGVGGRMTTEIRGGREWPPSAPNATAACEPQQPGEVCYLAGDVRVNQNTQLTVLQIILLREHNRIADNLAHLNPHWDDERIFQEARHINIGQFQHINYYEWLPILLGVDNMVKNHLIYQQPYGFINDYDSEVDPSILNEHATAAFRYFHTQIAGRLDLVSEERHSFAGLRISDWFNRPAIIEQGRNMEDLTRGLASQPQSLTDEFLDPEIKHYLFRGASPFGNDLRAIDIQRNRDHGLASYNDYREFCGLKRAHRFEDFHLLDNAHSPETVSKLQELYESPEDVDLIVGGSLEKHVEGAIAGPTFLCILTEQFFRTRVGDRFFYEGPHAGFTQAQLNEIRKASVSRLFCDNGDNVQTIQPQGFNRISHTNPLLPCKDLPFVDLSQWKEY